MDEHIRIARRYFSSFVADYHRAFEGRGRNPLYRVVNTLFRHQTFLRRLAIVRGFLEASGLEVGDVVGSERGTVQFTAPGEGAEVDLGTEVTLITFGGRRRD